ncbi:MULTISPECIES: hypothetical protein [Pseudoalteromonas]|uniref:Uncharacterized protein n=1 Tax=Pseudoalteromonas rhizosphaerae TaxID=2518973 RepID=A0ABW8KXR8_9GAMM|nr:MULTISPECIES: hypothetical protein [unclassified Pseudoalteromonas]MBB1417631.1 hypothetical protein [Pseudoalteromonas sp. SG44-1]MBB1479626.1 hypothetical protein [Pseudoalteromonas sp. SG41-2]
MIPVFGKILWALDTAYSISNEMQFPDDFLLALDAKPQAKMFCGVEQSN